MNLRKPFIVEFTGTPEAGKTTVINILYKQFSEMGYKVKLYPESAENTPTIFPKGSFESKLWMNFDTTKHVLEAPFQTEYDIILFDRGAFDSLFFVHLDSIYNSEIALRLAPFENILKDYFPDLLIAFFVSVDESIRRRGGEGRLVTKEFVSNYNRLLTTFINSLETNKGIIHTDDKSIEEVVETVKSLILENIKRHSS